MGWRKSLLMVILGASFLVVVNGSCTRGRDSDVIPAPALSPLEILTVAINAHGGERNILKPRKGVIKLKETVLGQITIDEYFDYPRRWVEITTNEVPGKKKVSFLAEIEGKQFRWNLNGPVQTVEVASTYFGSLRTLLELKGPNFKLTPLKAIDTQGQIGVGFQAQSAERTVDYFFDKVSGLLMQMSFEWRRVSGSRIITKSRYSKYNEMDGVMVPYRKTTFAKDDLSKEFTVMTELQIMQFDVLKELPEAIFMIPE